METGGARASATKRASVLRGASTGASAKTLTLLDGAETCPTPGPRRPEALAANWQNALQGQWGSDVGLVFGSTSSAIATGPFEVQMTPSVPAWAVAIAPSARPMARV